MTAQTPEAHAGPRRVRDRVFGVAGNDDLPPVGRGADPSRRVDRQTDVADIGEGGAPAVDPDADPDVEMVRPAPPAERPLDGHRGLDGAAGPLEDREELVGAGVDLPPACPRHRRPKNASEIVQEIAVAVPQPAEQRGGPLDIGHQEGHKPGGER